MSGSRLQASQLTWRQLIPVGAVVWLVIAVILFLIAPFEFSLADDNVAPDFVIETVDAGQDDDTLVLNLFGDFFFEQQRRLSETEYTPLTTELEDINLVESIGVGETTQVAITLAADTDPATIVDQITDVESVQEVPLNAIIVNLESPEAQAAFLEEFDSIRLIESIEPAPLLDEPETVDTRYIVVLGERADGAVFTERIGGFEGVGRAETAPLIRLIVTLLPDSDVEAFVQQFEGAEGIELAVASPLSRLIVQHQPDANTDRVIRLVEDPVNEYFPRSDLQINLWLPTASVGGETIVNIGALQTALPLYLYAVIVAVVEVVMLALLVRSDDKIIRPSVRLITVFLLFWSLFGHEPLWDLILGRIFPTLDQVTSVSTTSRVVLYAAEHLELVIVSSLITIPLGLFIGITVTRGDMREFLPLVNNVVNSGQTVPTLAIVAIMAPIIGFGFWPAIIALVLYGLLPVVRNTIVGLESVPAAQIDAAKGMGLTATQILFQIELPIASRIIMAGVRTSMVVNVGTATLGAFVGSGGLGVPISSGLSMQINAFVLLGAIPAALLAILIDYILGRIEVIITPKGLQVN